ncbi:sigma-70 family RNA polymerase sigma factor [Schauerella aestuarii]|uniref:sigma-70 family RNA polymerase sigma factor n=1 Tax=Schauerella aestuarii TaxID=2511204 RepID=UPI001371869E|nr:sigma-70 family RNA polymerase sigma factor [Achromobacter aestuarii]MYZ45816.1 sigma-70 family RNA polymerase sigma factor [Achromobacter aestuarii]
MTAPPLDTGCVQRLYVEHHGWLVQVLRRRLHCSHQAADLAQDVFVRVLTSRHREALREPRAYLRTVARGVLANHFRRADLERAYNELLAAMPQVLVPSAEVRLEILQTLAALDAMLDGLGARTRQIFLLSQLDGCTYPDIADRLGVSINVVQKAMSRAMAQCYRVMWDDDA